MKKILIALAMLLQTGIVLAQIKFEKSYQDALNFAGKKALPMLVYILPPSWPPIMPSGKPYVNGLEKPEVSDFYNKNFVAFKTFVGDTVATRLIQQYQLTKYPAFIFTDSKGYLLSKGSSGMSFTQPYLDMANEALAKLKSGKTLGSYEAQYQSGKRSAVFLKEFITYRMGLGLTDNAALIEDYVKNLKISDLDNYAEVLFIFQAGPFVYGKAYNLAYTNRKLVDSIYKKEPAALRSEMQRAMRTNTLAEAVRTKNPVMARNVSTFVSNSFRTNPKEGYKQSQYLMVYYNKAVKDTTQYMYNAINYYDQYFMGISADSINRMEKKLLAQRTKQVAADLEKNRAAYIAEYERNGHKVTKDSIVFRSGPISAPAVSSVAATLNNAAWDVYTLGIKNTNSLIKALLWSRRAIELSPSAGFYDTMAHIMYRLGFTDEAALNQDKAIALAVSAKQGQADIDKLRNEASLMKQRKL